MDLELIKKEFGLKVKLYRTQYKLTQEKFAEMIDIEQPTLSNIEKGKAYPTFTTVCSLIEKGGIEPNYLFDFLNMNTKAGKIFDTELKELIMTTPDDAKEHIKALLKLIAKR